MSKATARERHLPPTLSDTPLVRPAPTWALGLGEMPTETHFVRSHFPEPAIDQQAWRLAVDGLVDRSLELSLDDLRRLPRRELRVVLECAGHRRAEFEPPAEGLAWEIGAVSEATWSGTSLGDVLALAWPDPRARYTVLEGSDRGFFRDETDEVPFARALPVEKALSPDTLLAWEMNGEPLPHAHGGPVRAVVPGWYATDSVKWLTRVHLSAEPFDGPFEARDYRYPAADVEAGRRMTVLPVHALLLDPLQREISAGRVTLAGIAWGGEGGIAGVEVSIDRGPWRPAELTPPASLYARTLWQLGWSATAGDHELAVRATDGAGTTQPERPLWNPRGYANASIRRERLTVGRGST